MARQLFVNLPVTDLSDSMAFFAELGFGFDPHFTDERAACLVVGDEAFVMLLQRDFFSSFTTTPVADASTTEVTITVSATDRDEVDRLVRMALRVGGSAAGAPMEDGPLYGWSFKDPDGHHWEVIHMDPTAILAS